MQRVAAPDGTTEIHTTCPEPVKYYIDKYVKWYGEEYYKYIYIALPLYYKLNAYGEQVVGAMLEDTPYTVRNMPSIVHQFEEWFKMTLFKHTGDKKWL